jgi:hypothetical protein
MGHICGVFLMAALMAGPAFAQDRAADLHARFAHESDPVRKAKLMSDLGEVEFQEIHKDASDGNLEQALTVLQEYRDETRSCVGALDKAVPNAERHSAGFKQLQISLQESLRRLDTLIHTMTADEQGPFLDVRKDLDDMDRHILEELFPGKASEKPSHPTNQQPEK